MDSIRRKELGAYYTPDAVVSSLVRWAVRSPTDRLLDPSCGDGRFLMVHPRSVGVEGDAAAAAIVHARAPGALIHQGDFFAWAESTLERFECAVGNPPFIRYQRFNGGIRAAALRVCEKHGARFTALSSSWAPFLVATASLLLPGGRLAFVVPAEIGHAPYAVPLIEYLLRNFSTVKIIAVREKLFPELSEDCWLLYCAGFGGRSTSIAFTRANRFRPAQRPPRTSVTIDMESLRDWGGRLRPFLLPDQVLELYQATARSSRAKRLSQIAQIGIGYVTGANEFFHLRPSIANLFGIPKEFLLPAVRSARDLTDQAIDESTVQRWWRDDRPNFLLRIARGEAIPDQITEYLETADGRQARRAYKCRKREPWYCVPHVRVPDAFLSYMCGQRPLLVQNRTTCTATNTVHLVRMKSGASYAALRTSWCDPLTELSCELEGHPLGGGMLKLEPGEAARVLVRSHAADDRQESNLLIAGTEEMRRWRHYG